MEKKKELYEIVFDKNGIYIYENVSEILGMLMCERFDLGDRWSEDSRYTFSFNGYATSKTGFKFGTGKACLQSYLIDNNKRYDRFNINAITKSGFKLKMKTLKG